MLQDAADFVSRSAGLGQRGVGALLTTEPVNRAESSTLGLADGVPSTISFPRHWSAEVERGIDRMRKEPFERWSSRDQGRFAAANHYLLHEASHTVGLPPKQPFQMGPIAEELALGDHDVTFEEPVTELSTYALLPRFLQAEYDVSPHAAGSAAAIVQRDRLHGLADLPADYTSSVQGLDAVLAATGGNVDHRAHELAEKSDPGARLDALVNNLTPPEAAAAQKLAVGQAILETIANGGTEVTQLHTAIDAARVGSPPA